ncbi:hypothetical protein LC605_02980 [Nostoc sp. CHAB 5836]|nr:hypothetical protein [Nostoc sp. CHAB 5836]MCC5614057.1 hypothetical protein [Nostoc sp. CHAB 5836]
MPKVTVKYFSNILQEWQMRRSLRRAAPTQMGSSVFWFVKTKQNQSK